MTCLERIKIDLARYANSSRAEHSYGFFRAIPGGYGEGDRFLGIAVPHQRKIARQYWRDISLGEVELLLQDPVHECRLTALFILVLRFSKAAAEKEKEEIVSMYLRNLSYVNNWDLVDSSAPYILGPYLAGKDKTLLHELADSGELWKQRIAVLATFHFIRHDCYRETLELAEKLINHPHDLIHKAVGWMIREVAKRDFGTAYTFLAKHYRNMPRTALRYAIERFDPGLRQKFLQGRI